MSELATLAGGCFWCLEAVFVELEGVEGVTSGYTGGWAEQPSYAQVCSGRTGHAEAVQLRFDPAQIPYSELLEIFFAIHDPTTKDRQGHDIGHQYRSAIFYHDEGQKAVAAGLIRSLDEAGVYPAPIVTELLPVGIFYPAEVGHQDYFARNPDQPYCQAVISPKLAKFRKRFAQKLRAPV
jgi:peptide-methionine (S)-S-oxide reductase